MHMYTCMRIRMYAYVYKYAELSPIASDSDELHVMYTMVGRKGGKTGRTKTRTR